MEDDHFTRVGSGSIIPENLDEKWARYEQPLDNWRQEVGRHHGNTMHLHRELSQAVADRGAIGTRLEADPNNQDLKLEYKAANERVSGLLKELKGPEKPEFEDFN